LFETTGSDATVELAVQWLRDCVKHDKCTYRHDQPFPTRILDIGKVQSDAIILREPLNQSGRYICLSYCWSGADFINTTSENINDHKKGIPWEALPQTFQDVIRVARRLEIGYIWIDALCIVQDDFHDWEKEATKMATVYQNSFVTISATSAISPNAGLFSTPLKARVDSVYAQQIYHFPNSVTGDVKNQLPLLKQAWTHRRCWGRSHFLFQTVLRPSPETMSSPKAILSSQILTPPF
jgi:hypothetical protein